MKQKSRVISEFRQICLQKHNSTQNFDFEDNGSCR